MVTQNYSPDVAVGVTPFASVETNAGSNYDVVNDYDSLGNLISSGNGFDQVDYDYDLRNRLISADSDGGETTYTYNQANQRVSAAYPQDVAAGYAYDDAGRMIGIADQDSNLTTYNYDDGSAGTGRLQQIVYPGIAADTSSFTYTDTGQIASVDHSASFDESYTYDKAGNLTAIDSNPNTRNASFTYDSLNRMTGETWANFSTVYQKTYEYDVVGNRTNMITGTSPGIEIDYNYNNNQQLTSTQIVGGGSVGLTNFIYDDNGNMTQSDNNSDATDYSFNPVGKIQSVDFDNGLTYDYQYDSEGNRVQTVEDDGISPPTTTDYYYDFLLDSALSGPVLEIRSDDSGLFNLRADNGLLATQAYSPDIVTPGDFTGAEINAGMHDGFSNLVELASIVDSSSAWETSITAFGTSVDRDDIDGIGNQTGYLGRPTITPQGTDGLIDMNARSYNPELGRLMSVDSLPGDPTIPQSMNPYAYGGNNPYLTPDPTGLSYLPSFDFSSVLNSASDTLQGWFDLGIDQGCQSFESCDYYLTARPKGNFNWLNFVALTGISTGSLGFDVMSNASIGKQVRASELSKRLRAGESVGSLLSRYGTKNDKLIQAFKRIGKKAPYIGAGLTLVDEMMKDPSIRSAAKAGTISVVTAGSVTLASAACAGATAGITCVVVVPAAGIGGSIFSEKSFDYIWRKK